MLYVDTDDKLKDDEVQVVTYTDVGKLITDGWRILGIVSSTEPGPTGSSSYSGAATEFGNPGSGLLEVPGPAIHTPLFIMGRSNAAATLLERVEDAESAKREAEQSLTAADAGTRKIAESLDTAKENTGVIQSALDRANEKLKATTAKITNMVFETTVVRREVGEAKWREILAAMEVEQSLDTTTDGGGTDDDGSPF